MDDPHKRGSGYRLFKKECDPGYEKKCFPKKGMYIHNKIPHKPSIECFCYEKKYEEHKTTKDKTVKGKLTRDKSIKEEPKFGKPVKVFKNDPHCKEGEYYVCYDMSTVKYIKLRPQTRCHCSKHPF